MLAIAWFALTWTYQMAPAAPARPVDAIPAIVQAMRTHQLVALGEAHDNDQLHAFIRDLVRDQTFQDVANDIVVEFGNARYQDIMDKFVGGEDVPYALVRQVWENTTAPIHVWDVPIYEQFFRTVRTVNAHLTPEHRLRVVLGDSPIDWDAVHSREDIRQFANRDQWATEVIKREVVAKKRRALIVYGGLHLTRPGRSLDGLLEAEGTEPIFTIWTHTEGDLQALQADVAHWRVPTLVFLRGTPFWALRRSESISRLLLRIGRRWECNDSSMRSCTLEIRRP